MSYNYSKFVPILKAISDETRLKIIDILSCGEMCACDILTFFNITQSTLSYHMRILTDSGLINGFKDGSWMRYSINKENSEILLAFLDKITQSKSECICKNINHNLNSLLRQGEKNGSRKFK